MTTSLIHASETPFKNRVSVGLNRSIGYERVLPFSLKLGTEWKYTAVLESYADFHLDQDVDFWLLTLAHDLDIKLASVENKLRICNSLDRFGAIGFSSGLLKEFTMEERWALAVSVVLLEYTFDPYLIDDGRHPEWGHHGEMKTELNIELEFRF
jgi:hypothetical protein